MNQSIEKSHDISILIVSCDAYSDLWDPFFQCFFKYWKDCKYQVYLGSNKLEYQNPNVNNILVGNDKDYSSNLLKMLENIESEWVLLSLEDLFLSSPVNSAFMSEIIDLAIAKEVGYLKLSDVTPFHFSKNKSELIGELPRGVKYRSGIGLALWNKDVLKRLLIPGESAWEIERNGSLRSNSFIEPFCALSSRLRSNVPLKYKNTVIKGKWSLDAINFLRREGFEDCIPNRTVQSIWSYLYVKAYLFRLELYLLVRKYWYQ
jgi:hypothetical protein